MRILNAYYFTKVRWLSKGNMLERLLNLKNSVIEFLKNINFSSKTLLEFQNSKSVQGLLYLVDILGNLNSLNRQLQEAKHNMINLSDNIKALLNKVKLWRRSVESNKYSFFPSLEILTGEITIKQEIIRHLRNLGNDISVWSLVWVILILV